MADFTRRLDISVDGEAVQGVSLARLTGRDSVGLRPGSFSLRLWNLGDDGYYRLLAGREVAVEHEGSVLARGTVSDVYRCAVPEGTVTEAVFSPALPLWEAPVSLAVEAGKKVSETVAALLSASGTGVALLSFPGDDPVMSRGQSFFGRAAECVETALSAASARGCLTPAGLCVIPGSGLPVSMVLSEADLIDAPVVTPDGHAVLRTRVTGWPVGKMIRVSWEEKELEGIVTERALNADSGEGPWESLICLEI